MLRFGKILSTVALTTYKKYEKDELPFFSTQILMALVLMLNFYLLFFALNLLLKADFESFSIYLGSRDVSGGILAILFILISKYILFTKSRILKYKEDVEDGITKMKRFYAWAYMILSFIAVVTFATWHGSLVSVEG